MTCTAMRVTDVKDKEKPQMSTLTFKAAPRNKTCGKSQTRNVKQPNFPMFRPVSKSHQVDWKPKQKYLVGR